ASQQATVIDDFVPCIFQPRAARDLIHVVREHASLRFGKQSKLRIPPRRIERPFPDRKYPQVNSDVERENEHRARTAVEVEYGILDRAPLLGDFQPRRRRMGDRSVLCVSRENASSLQLMS